MIMYAPAYKEGLPFLGIRYQIKYHKCNLDCPYCIADWRNKENLFDIETFTAIIEKIKHLPYNVCLRIGMGGEIFTSQEILGVVRDICNTENNIFGVSFSSNIKANWDKRIKPFLESVDTSRLGMGCTLHDTVIKDVNGFFEKAKKIKEMGVLLYIGYVAIPQQIEEIEKYKKICDDLDIPFLLNALVGKIRGVDDADPDKTYPRDYTPEERAIMKSLWGTPHSYQMLVESTSPFRMPCSAGKNFIYINEKGDVSPCQKTRQFSLGNILEGPIRFINQDVQCPMNACSCDNQNQAMKIVDKYYNRTRTLRIYVPKEGMLDEDLYKGYPSSATN